MDHASILGAYLARIPEEDIQKVLDRHRDLKQANMNQGLSAQVEANKQLKNSLDEAIGKLCHFYRQEIEAIIKSA